MAVNIGLLLVDEIHQIGDGARGAVFESVICRMMNLSKDPATQKRGLPIENLYVQQVGFENGDNPANHLKIRRIVGLSATFSNVGDVASWIKCSNEMLFQVSRILCISLAYPESNPYLLSSSGTNTAQVRVLSTSST